MRLWQRKTSLTLLGSFTILQFLQGIVLAGPVKRSRFTREVYPEIEPEKLEGNQAEVCIVGDVIYGADEPVPADQPCLKCKCQPPGVQCETTRCVKKPGCRAIHKPNKCCPEYQCECEHQGKLYANGERLETPPGGECRVCYCRGGEVQCADVSCYLRTDCEGSTVPGQCCPKYDHCPPKEPLIDRLTSYTTQQTNITSENDSFTTTVYDLKEVTHDHNNKITETQTESALSQKTINTQLPNETVEDYNKINVNDVITTTTNIDELSKEVTRRNDLQGEQHKITIQEIIPEIKEIPITGPPKREVNLHIHQSIDDFSNKVEEKVGLFRDREDNVNDLTLGDTESDSSEISEIYHHPPPVLKIGDQLLFLKKGELVPGKDLSTPLPVITIIGAEGLQRGTEDSSETNEDSLQVQNPNKEKDDLLVNPEDEEKSDSSPTPPTHVISFLKPKNSEATTNSLLSTIENLLANITKGEVTNTDLDIFDFFTTETPSSEVENTTKIENETSNTDFNSLEVENLTVSTENKSEFDLTTLKSADFSTFPTESDENQTTTIHIGLKSDGDEIKVKKHEEVELNPEYPPIPDVMSPLNVDESDHVETELPQIAKQLIEATSSVPEGELNASSSSSLDESTTTEATHENQHPLINLRSILPTSILEEAAVSDFIDGASEEVNSTSSSNETSLEKSKETMEELSTEDSGENTTPKGLILSPIGDASVENYESHEINKKELLEIIPEVTNATIDQESSQENSKNESEFKMKKDVELIDPQDLIEKFKNEEATTKRTIIETFTEGKRYSNDPVADEIFKQLNDELKTVAPRVLKHLTKEEEEAEIFRELLEDATSTSSPNGSKEAQLMEKVSTAINKFQKKETKEPLDASIMKIIKEFFTAQVKPRGI